MMRIQLESPKFGISIAVIIITTLPISIEWHDLIQYYLLHAKTTFKRFPWPQAFHRRNSVNTAWLSGLKIDQEEISRRSKWAPKGEGSNNVQRMKHEYYTVYIRRCCGWMLIDQMMWWAILPLSSKYSTDALDTIALYTMCLP